MPAAGVGLRSGTDFTIGKVLEVQSDRVTLARHRPVLGSEPWTRAPGRLESGVVDVVSPKESLAGVDLNSGSVLEAASVEGLVALGLVEPGASA